MFVLHVNHHAHENELWTLRVHAKGVKRSNTNEMDRFKESEFPVIPAASPNMHSQRDFADLLCVRFGHPGSRNSSFYTMTRQKTWFSPRLCNCFPAKENERCKC